MKGMRGRSGKRSTVRLIERKLIVQPEKISESLGQRLSHWSQVAMLGLVAFGYFYTVRPVYQKERLEEEVAELQEASATAIREAELAKLQTSKLEESVKLLSERERELQNAEALLTEEGRVLRLRLSEMSSEANRLASSLDDLRKTAVVQRESIRAAHTAILNDRLQMAFGHRMLQVSTERLEYFEDEDDALDEWVALPQFSPFAEAIAIVEREISSGRLFELPEPHDVSLELVEDFQRRLIASQSRLECPQINKSRWRDSWIRLRAEYRQTIPACVRMHVDRVAHQEGWTDRQLSSWLNNEQGRRYAESAQHSCGVMAGYELQIAFSKARQEIEGACLAALNNAVAIVNGEKELERAGSLEPPSPDLNWYRDWYEKSEESVED